jgi:hypothetical protein
MPTHRILMLHHFTFATCTCSSIIVNCILITAPLQTYVMSTILVWSSPHRRMVCRGEIVGLGLTGHPIWCPIKALINRVIHLCAHNVPITTPLYSYHSDHWRHIDTTMLTALISAFVRRHGPAVCQSRH